VFVCVCVCMFVCVSKKCFHTLPSEDRDGECMCVCVCVFGCFRGDPTSPADCVPTLCGSVWDRCK